MGKKAAILLFIATVVISGCSTISQALDGEPENTACETNILPTDPNGSDRDTDTRGLFTGNVAERIHSVADSEFVSINGGGYSINKDGVNSRFGVCGSFKRTVGDVVMSRHEELGDLVFDNTGNQVCQLDHDDVPEGFSLEQRAVIEDDTVNLFATELNTDPESRIDATDALSGDIEQREQRSAEIQDEITEIYQNADPLRRVTFPCDSPNDLTDIEPLVLSDLLGPATFTVADRTFTATLPISFSSSSSTYTEVTNSDGTVLSPLNIEITEDNFSRDGNTLIYSEHNPANNFQTDERDQIIAIDTQTGEELWRKGVDLQILSLIHI